MHFYSASLRIGVALFSMFFGSGNLVYPLAIGQQTSGALLFASAGLLLSAVLLPLLGCLAMLFANGQGQRLFSFFGSQGYRIFSLVCLGLMGPFGVLGRCLTVIHGNLVPLAPWLSLGLCVAICSVLLWFTSFYRSKVLDILGKWLAPVLLFLLLALFIAAFYDSPPQPQTTISALSAFSTGWNQGYQMMDLVASFFFAGFVIEQLQQQAQETKQKTNQQNNCPLSLFFCSACLAGTLLATVYGGLIFLGGHYAVSLADTPAKSMLASIAYHTMGSYGAWLVALAVIMACYTTAVVLTTLFADFIHREILNKKLSNKKISYSLSLTITLAIAASVALLDFQGIAFFLGPILETAYPFLIAITLYRVAEGLLNRDRSLIPFAQLRNWLKSAQTR